MHKPNIYLGTVALEKNRWSTKIPTFLVSDWIPKFKAAGFNGLELWENHVLLSEGEAEKIKTMDFPVAVYNHYGTFTNSPNDVAMRVKAAEMTNFLGAGAVKYNIGNDPSLLDEYKSNVLKFAEEADCVLLCECHAGTLLEDDNAIKEFFKGLCPEKFALVVHPFDEPDVLRKKFEMFGERITHIHSQLSNPDGKRICLDGWPQRVDACLSIMKEYNFAGNFTIEFTELVATPEETIDKLFVNTIKDMQYVRNAF